MFRPLNDRIIVERLPEESMTESGIIIPDVAKEKPSKGKVVAAGNGVNGEPLEVEAGDLILFGKYSGQEVTIDDKELLIMQEEDVLAVIED